MEYLSKIESAFSELKHLMDPPRALTPDQGDRLDNVTDSLFDFLDACKKDPAVRLLAHGRGEALEIQIRAFMKL